MSKASIVTICLLLALGTTSIVSGVWILGGLGCGLILSGILAIGMAVVVSYGAHLEDKR